APGAGALDAGKPARPGRRVGERGEDTVPRRGDVRLEGMDDGSAREKREVLSAHVGVLLMIRSFPLGQATSERALRGTPYANRLVGSDRSRNPSAPSTARLRLRPESRQGAGKRDVDGPQLSSAQPRAGRAEPGARRDRRPRLRRLARRLLY